MSRNDLFEGLDSPPPPPGLREAALRAGRAALSATPVPDSWTALLTSRGLRVAWLTAVLLLTAANALVPPDRSHSPEPDRRLDREVAEIGRLPGLDGPDLPSLGKDSLEGDRL
jgi:hypothetical protein